MSRREPTELAEIEALASFLDARSRTGDAPPISGSTGVPDVLVAAARAVDAASQPRGLSARFAQRLEENLMDLAALDRPLAAPNHHPMPPVAPSPSPRRFPRGIAPPSLVAGRRRGIIELLGLTAVVALLFGQVMGIGGNVAFWQDSSPVPAQSERVLGLTRVDAGRSGSYADGGPSDVPSLRWIVDTDAAPGVFIQPIAFDSSLYIADYFGGSVSKIGADGIPAASVDRPTATSYVVDSGVVYVASGAGASATLGAYGDGDGVERWSVDTAETAAALGYDGERIYMVGMDGLLHAFDGADGSEAWSADLEVDGQGTIFQPATFVMNDSTPAVADGIVVVGTQAGDVRAFSTDDADGSSWTFDAPDDLIGSPSIVDGTVFVATRATSVDAKPGVGHVYALDAVTGRQLWEYVQPAWTESISKLSGVSPRDLLVLTVDSTTVYVNGDGPAGHVVTALSATSGEVVWSRSFDVAGGAAPVVSGDTLYLSRPDGGVYALDAATGDQRWRLDAGAADLESPAVVANLLIVTTSAGRVVAVADRLDGSDATPAADGIPAYDISGLPPCIAPRQRPDPLPTGEPATSLDALERPNDEGQGWALRRDLPTEPVADADTQSAILDTLDAMLPCDRPGREDDLGGFYTDDYYRRMAIYYPDVSILDLPWVARVPTAVTYPQHYDALDPVILEDGRVAQLFWQEGPRAGELLIFIDQDGAWLIDEVVRITEEPGQGMG